VWFIREREVWDIFGLRVSIAAYNRLIENLAWDFIRCLEEISGAEREEKGKVPGRIVEAPCGSSGKEREMWIYVSDIDS